jgi:hypothetical protein
MHWRRQGDLGELSAMEWFASKGASIAFPVGHTSDWDFIAEIGEEVARGANQSWNGIVKHLDRSRCEYLFVVVGDGRRWCIPSSALQGGSHLSLGGPKYAEFEVEQGRPLPDPHSPETASTIGSSNTRGDVRVAKGDGL